MSDALSTCAEILYEEWKEGFKYGFSSAFVRGVSFQDRRRLQCCILEVLLARFGDQGFSCASCIARVHDDWNLELLFKKALCTFSLSTFKIFLRSLAAAGPGTDRTAPEAEHRDTGDRKLNYAKNFGSGFEEGVSEGVCISSQHCAENFLRFRFGEEAQALLPVSEIAGRHNFGEIQGHASLCGGGPKYAGADGCGALSEESLRQRRRPEPPSLKFAELLDFLGGFLRAAGVGLRSELTEVSLGLFGNVEGLKES